jgi:hypothetical protein
VGSGGSFVGDDDGIAEGDVDGDVLGGLLPLTPSPEEGTALKAAARTRTKREALEENIMV